MSAPEHEFTCEACLCCVRCSIGMAELQNAYSPCVGGPRHYHPGMVRDPGEGFTPYVPDWAIPLTRETL